ncbi:hypothetical protein F5X99DRAFT_325142 [Biscogniauxia marginata]|nr:hypothetical protein F5X99DRAFT_325142 [Biscogniauxia marginata]
MNTTQSQASDAESDALSSTSGVSDPDRLIEQILGRRLPHNERTQATFAPLQDLRPVTYDCEEDVTSKWSRRAHHHVPCVCPECGKSLSRLDSLWRHRKSVHGVRSRHYCERRECAKHPGFSLSDNLRRHMKISHGIALESYGTEPYHRPKPSSDQNNSSTTETRLSTTESFLSQADASLYLAKGTNGDLTLPGTSGPDDLEYVDRHGLVQRLRAQIDECQKLQQQCRVLRLERDEYVEALGISEQLREKLENEKR